MQDVGDGGDTTINIKWLFSTILGVWPWFLISIIVAVSVAQLYLRYTTPIYSITTEIVINDSKKRDNTNVLENLGLSTGSNNIENEMRAIKSRSLMQSVVKRLNLNTRYYVTGRLKTAELYADRPFDFIIDTIKNPDGVVASFKVRGTNEGFTITDKGNDIKGVWDKPMKLSIGNVVLLKKLGNITLDDEYTINTAGVAAVAEGFLGPVFVNMLSKSSSTLIVSTSDHLPARGVDILNTLIEEYQKADIINKNIIANNTIAFIDERLQLVGQELTGVEKDIAGYKRTNQLTSSLEEQSALLVNNANSSTTEMYGKEVQLQILNSLENYVKQNRDIPGALVVTNPQVSGSLERYNTLYAEKMKLSLTSTEDFPYVQVLNKQIELAKNNLLASIASVKRDLQIEVNTLKDRSNLFASKMSSIPEKERVLLEYSRQQAIKQELYLFLLKKKEETAITKSSTISVAKVVDSALSSGVPISPNRSKIIYMSLFIGLLVPSIILYLRRVTNNRIINKIDISKQTQVPILGEIGHYDEAHPVAVKKNSKSVLAEQFRAIRTNMQFLLTPGKDKTILLTSSMSGEGKSFVAINLASTFALSGKKVVLLELDLRKPKISQNLGIDNSVGFSSYAIEQASYNEIIKPSGIVEDLFVIPSGPIPPNPAELIMLPKVEELFQKLKEDFDFLVIDTAPLGLVTDAQLLGKFVDASLYIVRQAYTYKTQVQIPNDIYVKDKLPKLSILVNDVKMNRGFLYGYGYGYGYGGYGYGGYGYGGYGYGGYGAYGNGYFQEDGKKKTGLNKIISKLKK